MNEDIQDIVFHIEKTFSYHGRVITIKAVDNHENISSSIHILKSNLGCLGEIFDLLETELKGRFYERL